MLKMEFKFIIYDHNINNDISNHFGRCISEKVKKNLRKSQAQFREKLRKLRLRQNYGFLIKKTCKKLIKKTLVLERQNLYAK